KDLGTDNAIWTLPGSRTKNGREHLVPLSPAVVEIIRSIPETSPLLFSTNGVNPASGFSRAKRRLDKQIDLLAEEKGFSPVKDWRLHDLRRTMVTMMNEELRIAPHVVEACINHISGSAKAGVAGVYNRALYLDERREALNAWSGLILNIAHSI
ncbi:MAG: tyrosine-type recombinase/integrase, partial [Desulfobulbia bacterium]